MMPLRAGLAHRLRQEGKTYGQIAKAMKCSTGSISQYLRTAEGRVNGNRERLPKVQVWDSRHPTRCRCGLMLPCFDCLPRRAEGFLRAEPGYGDDL